VIKEICSWLPPGLDEPKVCSQEQFVALPCYSHTEMPASMCNYWNKYNHTVIMASTWSNVHQKIHVDEYENKRWTVNDSIPNSTVCSISLYSNLSEIKPCYQHVITPSQSVEISSILIVQNVTSTTTCTIITYVENEKNQCPRLHMV